MENTVEYKVSDTRWLCVRTKSNPNWIPLFQLEWIQIRELNSVLNSLNHKPGTENDRT